MGVDLMRSRRRDVHDGWEVFFEPREALFYMPSDDDDKVVWDDTKLLEIPPFLFCYYDTIRSAY